MGLSEMHPWFPGLSAGHHRGAEIASICSGVGLAAETGMLDGKTGYHPLGPGGWLPSKISEGEMDAGVDAHRRSRVLRRRWRACRARPQSLSGRNFVGHEIALQSAKALLLIETPRARQAGFAIVPLRTEHSHESISRAQDWLHENFHRAFPLDDPARRVGMSLRNFVRRFKRATGDSPLICLQKLRVAAAKRLLENDHRTVQQVSDAVGYQHVAFFRNAL